MSLSKSPNLWLVAAVAIGAAGGYGYAYFTIQSSPQVMTTSHQAGPAKTAPTTPDLQPVPPQEQNPDLLKCRFVSENNPKGSTEADESRYEPNKKVWMNLIICQGGEKFLTTLETIPKTGFPVSALHPVPDEQ